MKTILIRFMSACVIFGALTVQADNHSNWGKWGKDDERGAANYLGPQQVIEAAKLIKTGQTFSLAIPIDANGPVFPTRIPPQHFMVLTGADYAAGLPAYFGDLKFADDYIYMPLQGSTQWDGLSHAWYGDTLYNGVEESAIKSAPSSGGATKLGIENVKTGFVGRAILIDIVAYKGGSIPQGYAISREDIEGALKQQKSTVKQGDIVMIRTGVVPGYYEMKDPISKLQYIQAPQAGINVDVIEWVARTDVIRQPITYLPQLLYVRTLGDQTFWLKYF